MSNLDKTMSVLQRHKLDPTVGWALNDIRCGRSVDEALADMLQRMIEAKNELWNSTLPVLRKYANEVTS